MTRDEAKAKLIRQRDQIQTVMGCSTSSPEFRKWKRDTELAIEYVFGKETRHLKDFTRISYTPSMYSMNNPGPAFRHFDDVRAEEWTPSYAGKSARTDFLLKLEQVVIEVKKTRIGLGEKEIGEQLIIDIARYRAHPDCKKLISFVYDPEGRIGNPTSIESDLSDNSGEFTVLVTIAPKGL